jgi:hypothetical protein
MKLLSFSNLFPKYHPKSGAKTYFPEQILNNFNIQYMNDDFLDTLIKINEKSLVEGKLTLSDLIQFKEQLIPISKTKIHTIRTSTKVDVNENFQPFIWSRKPYASPIIRFMPSMQLKEIQSVNYLYGQFRDELGEQIDINELAANDGLSVDDFVSWFEPMNTSTALILHFKVSN